MDGNRLTFTFSYPGTSTGNASFCWTMQGPATLLEMCTSGSNSNGATVTLGTSGNADAYILAEAVGDSNVPVVDDRGDFDGDSGHDTAECPHIAADTVMLLSLDYDGAGGTAVQNFYAVITMLEG